MRIIGVVLAALLALTSGCGSDTKDVNNASGFQVTNSPVAPTQSPTGLDPFKDTDLPDVKSYGVGSPECLATSNLMQQVVTLGLKITTGSTTQAEVDQAFRNLNQVPEDARRIAAQIKTLAEGMVGKSAQDSGEQVSRWGLALAQFTKATQKVCS